MKSNCPDEIKADLPGIIVMSHGPLALALIESTKLIAGESENLAAFSLEAGDTAENFRNKFIETLKKFPKGSLVLLDITGGTPFNQLILSIKQYDVEVLSLSGVNLPMVIEAVFARKSMSGKKLLKQIENAGREGIKNVTEFIEEFNKENEKA
ncbi:PTS fructose transporter subunit IIA [Acidilutibacter cellobiosedens]|uniref:PTS fructose transporter subunit IIA n=1 Tax=Acidilutibacter cellobiosedens TaxID=2507161 RepID=A0A410QD19_9FIRM|nr:PTS fructose transporter subunit IIA [Acidilutibacter cellobiosedens]QAT61886.1 PTS fructose transporter subunit IIA [Acidilutibacter cellobiosedens]